MLYIPANTNALAPVAELHLQAGEEVHIIGPEGEDWVIYCDGNGEVKIQR